MDPGVGPGRASPGDSARWGILQRAGRVQTARGLVESATRHHGARSLAALFAAGGCRPCHAKRPRAHPVAGRKASGAVTQGPALAGPMPPVLQTDTAWLWDRCEELGERAPMSLPATIARPPFGGVPGGIGGGNLLAFSRSRLAFWGGGTSHVEPGAGAPGGARHAGQRALTAVAVRASALAIPPSTERRPLRRRGFHQQPEQGTSVAASVFQAGSGSARRG